MTIVVSLSSAEAGLDVGIETRLSQYTAEVFELAAEPSGDSAPLEIQQPNEKGLFSTEIGPHEGFPIAVSSVPRLFFVLNSERVVTFSSVSSTFVFIEIEHVP